MMQLIAILVIAAVIAAVLVKVYAKKKQYDQDLTFPPAPPRADLLYGYYGCKGDQVAETKDHINLFMESQFDGADKAIQNILDAAKPTILDLSAQMFHREPEQKYYSVLPDAATRVVAFLQRLQDAGALQYVKYLYPIDEPNNTVGDPTTLMLAINIVRDASKQFPALDGVQLAVIYAADKSFICQEEYALVGFDDYDLKSHVLVSPRLQSLQMSLRPDQKIILVPGGSYGQDPKPFIDFAQGNPRVGMVMPFLWLDEPTVGKPGIRSNDMRAAYSAAGASVCSR